MASAEGAPVGARGTELSELRAYVSAGYQVCLICGISGSGKSQLLQALGGGLGLPVGARTAENRTVPTTQMRCVPVDSPTGKTVFIDFAGEALVNLHPRHFMSDVGRTISPEDLGFLVETGKNLAGVILLFDGKQRLEGERPFSEAKEILRRSRDLGEVELRDAQEAYENQLRQLGDERCKTQRDQEEILAWLLKLILWTCENDVSAVPEGMTLHDKVEADNIARKTRTEVPVLVLFSRADELLPPKSLPARSGRLQAGVSARFDPRTMRPAVAGYHFTPKLFDFLVSHVRRFRYDYAHSILVDEFGLVLSSEPCGVKGSVSWLLSERHSQAPATRHLLRIRRVLDRLALKGNDWRIGGIATR